MYTAEFDYNSSLGPGVNATALTAGAAFACALRTDGQIVCWGSNTEGELGIASFRSVGVLSFQMGRNLTVVDLGAGVFPTAV